MRTASVIELIDDNGNNCNDGPGRAQSVCVWRAAHG